MRLLSLTMACYYTDDNRLICTYYKNGKQNCAGFSLEEKEPTDEELLLRLAKKHILAPRSGECKFCGEHLDAYQTKMQTFDAIACLTCAERKNMWWRYSDG